MGATASLGAAILAARWLARRSAHQPPTPDSAAASPE